jgi:Ca-activated chloride channel family protein
MTTEEAKELIPLLAVNELEEPMRSELIAFLEATPAAKAQFEILRETFELVTEELGGQPVEDPIQSRPAWRRVWTRPLLLAAATFAIVASVMSILQLRSAARMSGSTHSKVAYMVQDPKAEPAAQEPPNSNRTLPKPTVPKRTASPPNVVAVPEPQAEMAPVGQPLGNNAVLAAPPTERLGSVQPPPAFPLAPAGLAPVISDGTAGLAIAISSAANDVNANGIHIATLASEITTEELNFEQSGDGQIALGSIALHDGISVVAGADEGRWREVDLASPKAAARQPVAIEPGKQSAFGYAVVPKGNQESSELSHERARVSRLPVTAEPIAKNDNLDTLASAGAAVFFSGTAVVVDESRASTEVASHVEFANTRDNGRAKGPTSVSIAGIVNEEHSNSSRDTNSLLPTTVASQPLGGNGVGDPTAKGYTSEEDVASPRIQPAPSIALFNQSASMKAPEPVSTLKPITQERGQITSATRPEDYGVVAINGSGIVTTTAGIPGQAARELDSVVATSTDGVSVAVLNSEIVVDHPSLVTGTASFGRETIAVLGPQPTFNSNVSEIKGSRRSARGTLGFNSGGDDGYVVAQAAVEPLPDNADSSSFALFGAIGGGRASISEPAKSSPDAASQGLSELQVRQVMAGGSAPFGNIERDPKIPGAVESTASGSVFKTGDAKPKHRSGKAAEVHRYAVESMRSRDKEVGSVTDELLSLGGTVVLEGLENKSAPAVGDKLRDYRSNGQVTGMTGLRDVTVHDVTVYQDHEAGLNVSTFDYTAADDDENISLPSNAAAPKTPASNESYAFQAATLPTDGAVNLSYQAQFDNRETEPQWRAQKPNPEAKGKAFEPNLKNKLTRFFSMDETAGEKDAVYQASKHVEAQAQQSHPDNTLQKVSPSGGRTAGAKPSAANFKNDDLGQAARPKLPQPKHTAEELTEGDMKLRKISLKDRVTSLFRSDDYDELPTELETEEAIASEDSGDSDADGRLALQEWALDTSITTEPEEKVPPPTGPLRAVIVAPPVPDADPEDDSPLPSAPTKPAPPVNPFVLTEKDAQSTFALEADTAAYTLSRRYISKGYNPPPAVVRMEEFINAFDYQYPAQTVRTFTVHAEAAPAPFGKKLTLLKVGVRGKVLGRDGRKRAHLIFVVDASGSMARRDRMPLVQHALSLLVSQLNPDDRVTLVTYGSRSRLMMEAMPAAQHNHIGRALAAIECGNATNMLSGIQTGYELARRHYKAGDVNRIILCSDGVANLGPADADAILSMVEDNRGQGITFTSVGVGAGSYDDGMMEQLANRGDGNYVYIDSAAEARRVFVDNFSATLQNIARDVKIQVEFNPAKVRRYRLIGYENRDIADKDFRNDKVDAGEIGSGQSATALYELELHDSAAAESVDFGTVFVRYKAVDDDKVTEFARRLAPEVSRLRTPQTDPRFFLAACVAEFAEILRNSEHAGTRDLHAMKQLLIEVANALPLDNKVQELLKLVENAQGQPVYGK